MLDELLDIIDKNNTVIGQGMKSIIHEKGLRHRVSAVLVKDNAGKYLIPTASDIKVEAGGLFHSAAGHIPTGEGYKKGAVRELWEETGLRAEEKDFSFFGTFWLEKEYPTRVERERFEVFTILYRPEMGTVTFNEEQNTEQWFSEEELRNIYLHETSRLSYPLLLSCQHIFRF
jgi:8-oxo-dGTP pyrophosphatase MutT (NUDIX family)